MRCLPNEIVQRASAARRRSSASALGALLLALACSDGTEPEGESDTSTTAVAPPATTAPPSLATAPTSGGSTNDAPAPAATADAMAPASDATTTNEPTPAATNLADTSSGDSADVVSDTPAAPSESAGPEQELPPAETPSEPTDDNGQSSVSYMLGADISFVQEEEDKGVVFTDDGVQKDFLQLMKDHGFNFVRLRLFHDPGAPGGYQTEFVNRAEPYCDTAHTIEMAQRVAAAGMGLLLDFHYSDSWADPDDQRKPAAWEEYAFSELTSAVYEYTRDTLLEFEAAGALPQMVQVGNEITPGMLRPDGASYDPNNWDQLAELLTAGLTAVKDVDGDIQTMLHIDRGGDNETTVWWVGEAVTRGVEFDVLGQSAYSAYHGGPADWEANFVDMAERYPDLKFVVAEYNGDKRALNDIMRALPDGRGLGTFFWEPTANGEWGDAMFTRAGSEAQTKPADWAIYDQIADDYELR